MTKGSEGSSAPEEVHSGDFAPHDPVVREARITPWRYCRTVWPAAEGAGHAGVCARSPQSFHCALFAFRIVLAGRRPKGRACERSSLFASYPIRIAPDGRAIFTRR